MYRDRARLLLCRAMLCYAVLCARLRQGLGVAVRCYALLYALLGYGKGYVMLCYTMLCYAMLCYARARARLRRGFSTGCTGVQTHPQPQLQLQDTAIGSRLLCFAMLRQGRGCAVALALAVHTYNSIYSHSYSYVQQP